MLWASDRQTLREYIDRELVPGVRLEHLDSKPQGAASVAIDGVEALGYEKLVYFLAEAAARP